MGLNYWVTVLVLEISLFGGMVLAAFVIWLLKPAYDCVRIAPSGHCSVL
jgi:hypothetical protein